MNRIRYQRIYTTLNEKKQPNDDDGAKQDRKSQFHEDDAYQRGTIAGESSKSVAAEDLSSEDHQRN